MLKSLICNNKQRVSLTTDLWTSIKNMSYMVITAHFIDSDWCLNRRIISFSVIEDHRGKTRNDDALVLAVQYMHVRCCAHILNLIVVLGLNELHASVAAIWNAVKYVRSSTTRLHAFKQCAQQVKCPNGTFVLDCPTRWNSTYLMLMTLLKFQAAFDRMAEVNKPYEIYFLEKETNAKRVGPPGLEDWESAERIVKFLKIIFANDGSKVEEMTKAVKYLLNELYDAYSAMCSSSTPSMCSESVPSGSYGGTSYSPNFTTDVGLAEDEGKRVVSEVERYLSDPIEDPSNLKLNVFLWWKVNGSKYPILEKITRDVLAVLVSTVASESAFSTGRCVIDEYRSSLTPCMIEALLCTEN
ncbi:putative AC transposase [Citrus sinensis]|uniref:AC transposase n=1 Tax=Citrus sinensis TaxID=2711 RepID=A0ACB8JPK9_CITSI|nr:putative AC transposase [Citrus sinensis]